MTVLVDTSALYALLDADQTMHGAVASTWEDLLDDDTLLLTTNYILLETVALVQHRLGMDAVRDLTRDLLPVLGNLWIGEEEHAAAVSALLAADRRRLGLVDCTSLEVMRRSGIRTAFALDEDFRRMGFEVLPSRD